MAFSVSVAAFSMSLVFAISCPSSLFSKVLHRNSRVHCSAFLEIPLQQDRRVLFREVKFSLLLPTCFICSLVIMFGLLSVIERLRFSPLLPYCVGLRCLPGFNVRCALS